jgi:hypothetical protein
MKAEPGTGRTCAWSEALRALESTWCHSWPPCRMSRRRPLSSIITSWCRNTSLPSYAHGPPLHAVMLVQRTAFLAQERRKAAARGNGCGGARRRWLGGGARVAPAHSAAVWNPHRQINAGTPACRARAHPLSVRLLLAGKPPTLAGQAGRVCKHPCSALCMRRCAAAPLAAAFTCPLSTGQPGNTSGRESTVAD